MTSMGRRGLLAGIAGAAAGGPPAANAAPRDDGGGAGVEVPDAVGRRFTALRRATVLKGVGHNAPQEAPGLFAAAVLELGP